MLLIPSARLTFSRIEQFVWIEQLLLIFTLFANETFFPIKLFVFNKDLEAIDVFGMQMLKSSMIGKNVNIGIGNCIYNN